MDKPFTLEELATTGNNMYVSKTGKMPGLVVKAPAPVYEDIISPRAISIRFDRKFTVKKFGWLKAIWGYDIFLNDVPFLKTIILLNIIVWIVVLIGG